MLADTILPVTKNSLLMKNSTVDNSEQGFSTSDSLCGQSDKKICFLSFLSGMDKEALLQLEPDEAELSVFKNFIQKIDSKKDKDQTVLNKVQTGINPVDVSGNIIYDHELLNNKVDAQETKGASCEELKNDLIEEPVLEPVEKSVAELVKEPILEPVEKSVKNTKEPLNGKDSMHDLNSVSYKESGIESNNGIFNKVVPVVESDEQSTADLKLKAYGSVKYNLLDKETAPDSSNEKILQKENHIHLNTEKNNQATVEESETEQSTPDLKPKAYGSVKYNLLDKETAPDNSKEKILHKENHVYLNTEKNNKAAVEENENGQNTADLKLKAAVEKNEVEIADKVFSDDKQSDGLSYVKKLSSQGKQPVLVPEQHDVKKNGINFNGQVDKITDSLRPEKTEALKTEDNIVKDSEKIDPDVPPFVKTELAASKESIKVGTNNSLKIFDGKIENKNMESKNGNGDLNENKFSLHSGHDFDNIGEVKTVENKAEPFSRVLESKISEQIIEKVGFNIKNGKKEITIKLKPESLGRISMKISTDNQQVMVKVIAEHSHVKELIENNLNQLKTALNEHGLEVDKFDVSLAKDSGQSFDEYESNLFNKYDHEADADLMGNPEPDEFENEEIVPDLSTGNGSISYFA